MGSLQHGVFCRTDQPLAAVTRWLDNHCVGEWIVEDDDSARPIADQTWLRVLFARNGDRLVFIREFTGLTSSTG